MTNTDTSMDDARALDGPFYIGGTKFLSRLIVGTGKYESNRIMVDAIRASGAEMVTVAVRRQIRLQQRRGYPASSRSTRVLSACEYRGLLYGRRRCAICPVSSSGWFQ